MFGYGGFGGYGGGCGGGYGYGGGMFGGGFAFTHCIVYPVNYHWCSYLELKKALF